MVRILVDEDLPRSVASALREAGHDAVDVVEAGLRGKSDEEVHAYSAREHRVLVTADLGLANPFRYSPDVGTVLVRLPNAVRDAWGMAVARTSSGTVSASSCEARRGWRLTTS